MARLSPWRQKVKQLKTETYALYLAYRDPRTPWYARIFAALVVGYALSPLDLIPDFIPILGLLDDLVLIPLGILLARHLIPATVLAECRLKAATHPTTKKPASWIAAGIIIALWLLLAGLALYFLAKIL
jgi:uncharacterized membrane protein YkvA (DUF1232 family)